MNASNLLIFFLFFTSQIPLSLRANENLSSQSTPQVFSDFSHSFHQFKKWHESPLDVQNWMNWVEEQIPVLKMDQKFSTLEKPGYALSQTSVHFSGKLQWLEQTQFNQADIQAWFFPEIQFRDCKLNFCSALQKVGAVLPDAHFISHYQLIVIREDSDLKKYGLPSNIVDPHKGPVYIILQAGTHWSQYFRRALSVTLLTPDSENSSTSYTLRSMQALSLTSFGALGISTIEDTLNRQTRIFLRQFESLVPQ